MRNAFDLTVTVIKFFAIKRGMTAQNLKFQPSSFTFIPFSKPLIFIWQFVSAYSSTECFRDLDKLNLAKFGYVGLVLGSNQFW